MLGQKQKRLLNILLSKGFITQSDFKGLFNLNDEKAINKIIEFELMGWITKRPNSELPIKYIEGKDFPQELRR